MLWKKWWMHFTMKKRRGPSAFRTGKETASYNSEIFIGYTLPAMRRATEKFFYRSRMAVA
jgi:hypothetical protein